MRRRVVLFLLSAVLGPARDLGAGQWFVVESKNFRLYSDGRIETVEPLVLKLERFRQWIARLYKRAPTTEPVSIVAFQNPSVFAKFRPCEGERRVMLGYKFNAGIEDMVGLALYDRDRATSLVLFYETFHALTHAGEQGWPGWLEEGSAEVFGAFEERDGAIILGIPRLDPVRALRRSGLIPMERFLNGRAEDSPMFYPQSWALTHWLTCAERGAGLDQLREFMRRLREGQEDTDAFQQAFGVSLAAVPEELQKYIRKEEFPMWQFPVSAVQRESGPLTNYPISEARRDCIFGNVVLSRRDVQRAEFYFKQANKIEPDLAAALEGLGFVAALQDRYAAARQYFEQAFARNSGNYRARYFYALALYVEHGQQRFFAEPLPRETTVAIVESLKKAIEPRPNFSQTYELLARLTLNPGEDPHEGEKLICRALPFQPGNLRYRRTHGKLPMRLGDSEGARQTLRPLLRRGLRNTFVGSEAYALNEELQKISPGGTGHG